MSKDGNSTDYCPRLDSIRTLHWVVLSWTAATGKIDFRVQGISCVIKLIVLGLVASSANKKADVNRQLLRFERVSFSRGIF